MTTTPRLNGPRRVVDHLCGHFPEGTEEFTEEEVQGETRGDWYVRQMLGSGPLHRQFGSVVRKIVRLALPGRGRPRAGDTGAQLAAADPRPPDLALAV